MTLLPLVLASSRGYIASSTESCCKHTAVIISKSLLQMPALGTFFWHVCSDPARQKEPETLQAVISLAAAPTKLRLPRVVPAESVRTVARSSITPIRRYCTIVDQAGRTVGQLVECECLSPFHETTPAEIKEVVVFSEAHRFCEGGGLDHRSCRASRHPPWLRNQMKATDSQRQRQRTPSSSCHCCNNGRAVDVMPAFGQQRGRLCCVVVPA